MQLSLTHELMHVETVSMQLFVSHDDESRSGCGVGREGVGVTGVRLHELAALF